MGLGVKLLLGSVLVAVAAALAFFLLRTAPITVSSSPDHPLSAFYLTNDISGAVVGHEMPEEVEPEPAAGEILVQVSHFGLNPIDWKLMPLSVVCRPDGARHGCPLGVEGSGIVRKSASSVHAVGARVFFSAPGCARGRLLRLPEGQAGAVPAHWSLRSAAAMPVAFQTGLTGLRLCGSLVRGAALVVGGGTACGRAMLQLLRAGRRFERVVASCGNPEACLAAGADAAIARHNETLEGGARRLGVRGLGLVYEATHDAAAWPLAQRLGAECFLAIDPAVHTDAPLPELLLGAARLLARVAGRAAGRWIWGGPQYHEYVKSSSPEDVFELARLMRSDAVAPSPIVEYPFTTQGLREALTRIHDLSPGGKIVIKMAQSKKE